MLIVFLYILYKNKLTCIQYINISYGWSWRKIADIYGVSPSTDMQWSMA